MAINKCSGALAAMVLVLSACGGTPVKTEEEAPRMATVLMMSDPRAAQQLLNGFYALEQNQWRWTAGKFAVALRPPTAADQKGATLRLKLTVPEVVVTKLKSVTLTARVGGTALAPETYKQPGEYVFAREVPAAALAGQSVKVEFTLDHAIPSGAVEQRELGVVVSMVGLEAK